MISSSSSSSSRGVAWLVVALAVAGCRGAPPVPASGRDAGQGEGAPGAPETAASAASAPASAGGGPKTIGPPLALFPIQNLTGGAAPTRELTAELRERLVKHGLLLVPDEAVRRPLAARRIRYTGGLDREGAAALRDEAGVAGVIIPSLETLGTSAPFRVALTVRLLSTEPEPAIRWLHTFPRSGVDAPGPFSMNVYPAVEPLRDSVFDEVAAALAAALGEGRPRPSCPEIGPRKPDRTYRSPLVADPSRKTLAVLPFLNDARRRDAGEVVAEELLTALVASGAIHVVEPGVVRSEMLAYRFGANGGISLDDARSILDLLHADLILSGTVRRFEEAGGPGGVPRVEFSTWVLDRETGRLVWSSTASGAGDDGVWLFGAGRVMTASGLACGLAKGIAAQLLRDRPVTPPAVPALVAPPAGELRAWEPAAPAEPTPPPGDRRDAPPPKSLPPKNRPADVR
jgi:TolB-like protein